MRTIASPIAFAAALFVAAAAHSRGAGDGPGLAMILGQFHPVAVHFPVALILTTLLAEALWLATKSEVFANAGRVTAILAALGAIAAVVLGLLAESAAGFEGEYHEVAETHELFGIISMVLAAAAGALSEIGRRKGNDTLLWAYRGLVLAASITVTITGFYGGQLVRGIGHYVF